MEERRDAGGCPGAAAPAVLPPLRLDTKVTQVTPREPAAVVAPLAVPPAPAETLAAPVSVVAVATAVAAPAATKEAGAARAGVDALPAATAALPAASTTVASPAPTAASDLPAAGNFFLSNTVGGLDEEVVENILHADALSDRDSTRTG